MMTTLFRVVLILVSFGTFALVIQRIRHSRMQIEDAVFWVLLCIMFVIFALIPALPDFLAHLLGIYSTANFLFLFMIFVLLMKVFSMSMHISVLEAKLRELAQEEALREFEKRQCKEGKEGSSALQREKTVCQSASPRSDGSLAAQGEQRREP